jgi:hypothetical protein
MIYRGKVTALDSRGAYVLISALSPRPFGPLVGIGAAPSVGDSVLVADAGDSAAPDLVVLGSVEMGDA